MTHPGPVRRSRLRHGLTATALAATGALVLATPAAATPAPSAPPAAVASDHVAAPVVLTASLSGEDEVPAPGTDAAGDPDGTGDAVVVVDRDRVDFALSWNHIGAPIMGHVHLGDAGVNGPVDVPFFTSPLPDGTYGVTGSVTDLDPGTLAAIADDPAGFYVNLHSAEHPGGAVRGQLTDPGSDALDAAVAGLGSLRGDVAMKPLGALTALRAGGGQALLADPRAAEQRRALKATGALTGTILAARGSGAAEVPVPDGPAVGDPDGASANLFRVRGRSVEYAIAFSGVGAPTMAHIHSGAAGANGPVVVPFFDTEGGLPPTINGIIGAVEVDPALARKIAHDPSAYYTNLHTAAFPGGAVRGQLVDASSLF